jgi:hypothetical protein
MEKLRAAAIRLLPIMDDSQISQIIGLDIAEVRTLRAEHTRTDPSQS